AWTIAEIGFDIRPRAAYSTMTRRALAIRRHTPSGTILTAKWVPAMLQTIHRGIEGLSYGFYDEQPRLGR
ncbi:MAG: hypothetical protein ACYS8Z_25825, partial [Planctomycetota bacterium]